MPFSVKHEEADRLARELSALTGESLTQAVLVALRERVARQRLRAAHKGSARDLLDVGRRCAALPVLDARAPDEILGYDEHGLPG